jgi:K+-transporting ATPase A subunit
LREARGGASDGETTLSYRTQMLGLTVQNFVSASVGIVIVIVLIRGFVRRSPADLTRDFVTDALPRW